ncbi:hypothetical protein MHTCC0001_16610 [Flavobacteriaceae bacterium MHTCC 0001]
MKSAFLIPIINEAIYLASPELHLQLKKWFEGKVTNLKKKEKLKEALLKYIIRLSTRCTPFGLFASCTTGHFSHKERIELDKFNAYKRLTRFDMTFIMKLSKILVKDEILKDQLKYFSNSSLYKVGGHYRYAEYFMIDGRRQYILQGIRCSKPIEQVIESTKNGKSILDLIKILVDDEISKEEAKLFINNLIENQVLVSELDMTLTGRDNLDQLITAVRTKSDVMHLNEMLCNFKKNLLEIDLKFGNSYSVYENLQKELKLIDNSVEAKHLFQTDLFATTQQNNLNNNVSQTVRKAMSLLNRMSLPYENKALTAFKRAFVDRYEDMEMPLNVVLDGEVGIGYNQRTSANDVLLEGLQFSPEPNYSRLVEWTNVDSILQKKLITALRKKEDTIYLDDDDFNDIAEKWDDLPDTMSSLIEIVTLGGKKYIVIDSIEGSSAANLLGRFGYGDDKLKNHLNEIVNVETKIKKDFVLAEIIHLPQERVGNILKRPVERQYEIPYLAKSVLPVDRQIKIEDIFVSVNNNRIFLRCSRLNKYIEPRLTNAHNFPNDALPIYHFLCDLQSQNIRPYLSFSWNSILQEQTYLPRVMYKDCILSKARWLIYTDNFRELFAKGINFDIIQDWRTKNGLPVCLELIEGDNTLLINFKNLDSVKMLFNTVKNRTSFLLREFLFTEDGVVQFKGSTFCNQFIVSCYNQEKLNLAINENEK